MICRICRQEYVAQTLYEPAEQCVCGEMADVSPWAWDRWRGLLNAARYRVAARLFDLAGWLIDPERRP
jgi:hypothetical protein